MAQITQTPRSVPLRLNRLIKRFLPVFACTVLISQPAAAQEPVFNKALREEVVMVKKVGGLFDAELETTIFKPPGAGPFPVVVINHGKSPGDPRFQARGRMEWPAREFVARGYMVALPMRQGFSKSTGGYIGGGCNVESNGRVQAEDVAATLNYLKTLPDADAGSALVVGQSHGGLTTMAFGTLNLPNVAGLINFAGGLRQDSCPGWEGNLSRAFGNYGKQTQLKSLWFYGDNDSFWQPWLYKEMYQKYTDAGGKARLVAFGNFGTDAHSLFGSRSGIPVWVPEVERFLAELGLPFKKIHNIAIANHEAAPPASSGFAAREDEKALPFVKDPGRLGYQKFLDGDAPKAYALSPKGAWAYVTGRANAMKAATERCNQNAKDDSCKLYAVDDDVVWRGEK